MSVTSAYLKLTGEKSGELRGVARQRGLEGAIPIIAVQHEIIAPKDIATGLSSGKRQHQPIVITKEVDNVSPILYQMLTTNELIREASLLFYGTDPSSILNSSVESNIYTITFRAASISKIELALFDLMQKEKRAPNPIEYVSFFYDNIEWKWTNGNIISRDNWTSTK
jgi:type VI secretion system secreted protein Hcp